MTEHPIKLYTAIAAAWNGKIYNTNGQRLPPMSAECVCDMLIAVAFVEKDDADFWRRQSDYAAIRDHLNKAGNGV